MAVPLPAVGLYRFDRGCSTLMYCSSRPNRLQNGTARLSDRINRAVIRRLLKARLGRALCRTEDDEANLRLVKLGER